MSLTAADAEGQPLLAGLAHPLRQPGEASVGDLDGDGDVDLVVHSTGYLFTPAFVGWVSEIHVLEGRGDGSFEPPRVALALPDAHGPFTRLLRWDDDEHLDLLLLGQVGDHKISVAQGRGDASFDPPEPVPDIFFQLPSIPADLFATGDFDEDGRTDVVAHATVGSIIGGSAHPALITLAPQGDGSAVVGGVPVEQWWEAYRSIATGDVDEDGHLDVVAIVDPPYEAPELRLYRGAGDGSFALPEDLPGPAALRSLVLADLDGDGHIDAATLGREPGDAFDRVTIRHGAGDGSFVLGATHALAIAGHGPARRLLAGDVDGDGALDLLAPQGGAGVVSVLPGRGLGGFLPAVALPVLSQLPGWSVVDSLVADLNDDGRADLVVSDRLLGVRVLLGSDGPFVDIGFGFPRPDHAPALTGRGSTAPGEPFSIALTDGGGASGFLVVGVQPLAVPIVAGAHGPLPFALLPITDGDVLAAHWPPGLAFGEALTLQAWLAGSSGVTASNALAAVALD